MLLLIFLVSCKKNQCTLESVKFTDVASPFEVDVSSLDKAECEVKLGIYLYGVFVNEKTKLYLEDKIYKLAYNNHKKIKLFDLNILENDTYFLDFENVKPIKTVLQKKIRFNNNLNQAFQFRLKEAYNYEGYFFDIVVFLTEDKFIIGSYISKFDDDGVEVVIKESGEIFPNIIDYSNKRFRKLL